MTTPTTKKYLRMNAVAERYSTTTRTIQRWVEEGRLPAPAYFGRRFPLWDLEGLDANDKRVVVAAAAKPRRAKDRQQSQKGAAA